jgi:hypothetical protein
MAHDIGLVTYALDYACSDCGSSKYERNQRRSEGASSMSEAISSRAPAVSKGSLQKILENAKLIDNRAYRSACRTYTAKTFYFFCKRLIQEPIDTAMRSPDLRAYLEREIGPAILNSRTTRFNPDGWYGSLWKRWDENKRVEASPFREEYYKVLAPVGDRPYCWQIRPEYYETIKQIMLELEEHVAATMREIV